MAKNVFTHILSEPLNGSTTVKVNINPGDGNLTIDRLTGGEQNSGKRHAAVPGEQRLTHPVWTRSMVRRPSR